MDRIRPSLRAALSGLAVLAAVAAVHSTAGATVPDKVIQPVKGIDACVGLAGQPDRLTCYGTLCAPNYKCAESLLVAATDVGGPAKGIDVLHDLMEAHTAYAIDSDGHELAHVVGREAAKHYGLTGEVFMQCPRDFFYGCGHGFFEVALALADSQSGAAVGVCGSLPIGQRFVCYHGVGHGLMMSHGDRVGESLAVCNQLPASELADQGCWQGVFMENVNTFIRRENLPDVFDPKDLLSPCDHMDARYNRECYLNQAAVLVMNSNNDIVKASQACLKAGPTGVAPCIEGLGQFTTSPGWQDILTGKTHTDDTFLPVAVDLCSKFPAGYTVGCQTAAAGNLINYDSPDKALQFCQMLDDIGKDACLKKVVIEVNRPIMTDAVRTHVCDQLAPQYKALCVLSVAAATASSAPALKKANVSFADSLWNAISGLFHWLTAPLRFIAWLSSSSPAPVTVQSAQSPPPAVSSPAVSSPASAEAGVVVHYSGDAFIPNVIDVSAGETVEFVNDGDGYLWPASDHHPTHELYPAFDAKRAVTKAEPWFFTFKNRGRWPFHNHLSTTATGTVIVR